MPVQRRDVCGHRGRMSLQMNFNIMLLLSRHSMCLCPLRSWWPCFTPTYIAHCHYGNSEACCNLPQQHSLGTRRPQIVDTCSAVSFALVRAIFLCSFASFSFLLSISLPCTITRRIVAYIFKLSFSATYVHNSRKFLRLSEKIAESRAQKGFCS